MTNDNQGRSSDRPGPHGPEPSLSHIDTWVEQAVDYLDGRTTLEQKAAIEAHLAACPACAERIAEQQRMAGLLQTTTLDDTPAHLQAAIMERVLPLAAADIAQAISEPSPKRRFTFSRLDRRLRRWIPVTAVVIVALVASMATYGALKQNMHPSLSDQSADPRVDAHALLREETTAAGESSFEIEQIEPTATTDSLTTEGGGGGAPSTTAATIAAASAPVEIREKAAMKAALQSAEDTVVFAFEAPEVALSVETVPDETPMSTAPADDTTRFLAAAVAEDVAYHLRTVIDLQRLPAELSSEGPVFAALVSPDQLLAFWQSLIAIEASHDVSLTLRTDPDLDEVAGSPFIKSNRPDIPVVYGRPASALDGDMHFTTTSLPAQVNVEPTVATPSTGGEGHILIIIAIRRM